MWGMSALPLALRSAWRGGARSLGLRGGRGNADVIHAPPPQQRGGGRAGYSEHIDGQRDRETGDRQAHVQAMPGEAARAELPLPEAVGSGSRTGETAAAPRSGPIPFSGFLSLHPSAS